VIFVVDTQVPWIPGPRGPSADSKILILDLDPIHSGIPIFEFPAHLRLIGDSEKTLPLLLEEVRRTMAAPQRERARQRTERVRQTVTDEWRRAEQGGLEDGKLPHITRRWLAYQLGRFVDDEMVVVSESADATFIRREKPATMFEGGGGAGLGWAAAAAVGAKFAQPSRTFVCLTGDGSYTFSIPTAWLWAALHYKAPTLTVIFNNRGYHTGTTAVAALYPGGYAMRSLNLEGGWFDPPPPYAAEAAAAGAYGEKIISPEDVQPALARGLQAVREGVPAVLDVWLPKHVTDEV
jgi:acetolactate synthase-1/2/3 large subunit